MVIIQLDKERHLFYGLRAMRVIQETTGKNPYEPAFWKEIDAKAIGVLLWAGLKHEDNDLTVDRAEELVDKYSNIKMVIEKIIAAYKEAMQTSENPLPKNG